MVAVAMVGTIRQMLREPPRRPLRHGLLLVSMATARPTVPAATQSPGAGGDGWDNGVERGARPRLQHPMGTGTDPGWAQPRPITCGSGCCTLSCASMSSLSICSSRDARIWRKSGGQRGLGPPHSQA